MKVMIESPGSPCHDTYPRGRAPYLCVYASQLAACVGENKHKKMSEAAEVMWERADPEGYRRALVRNDILTDEERLSRIELKFPEVHEMVVTAQASESDSSDKVSDRYGHLARKFEVFAEENKLNEDDRRVVDDAIRRTSYTSFGNNQESHVFDHLKNSMGWDIVEDQNFYKVQAGVVQTPYGDFPWFIGGKIDAISSDRSFLVEIKCRVNRLFRRVPPYEMYQIQSYLNLLNIDKAVLAECLFTKGNDVDISLVPIQRDREMWTQKCMPKLTSFVAFVANLTCDAALQDKFLSSKRRNALIANFSS